MSSTWPKKFEQRLINLRSMSVIDGEKIIRQKFFHHKLIELTNRKQYWHLDGQNFVEMTYKSCSMPNDEKKELFQKKTSSKNVLGYVVSKCHKFADCIFDKKNRYFSVQFWKNMKKTNNIFAKTMFCIQIFLWTRRMQFC